MPPNRTTDLSPRSETPTSSTSLVRFSGLAQILAFALSLAGGVLHPIIDGDSHSAETIAHARFPIAHLLVFLGGAFLLIGLPGLYARIAPMAGRLGLAGFILYFLANATLVMFFAGYEAFVAPLLAGDPATSGLVRPDGVIPDSNGFAVLQGIGGLAYMAGLLLFGIAVVCSRMMPRWTGVLLAVAPVFLLLPVPERSVLTGLLIELPRGLAVAAMGYMLFTSSHRQSAAIAGIETARPESRAAWSRPGGPTRRSIDLTSIPHMGAGTHRQPPTSCYTRPPLGGYGQVELGVLRAAG